MIKTIAIICAHNGEKYISDQINSILNQSNPIDKLIVYDFNSKDNTADIVKKFSENNSTIELKKIPYADGASNSFLYALNDIEKFLNKNSILYICDQDDVWKYHKNEIITNLYKKFIDKKKYILIHHDVEVVDENLQLMASSYYDKNTLDQLTNESFNCDLVQSTVIGHTVAINYDLLRILNRVNPNKIIMHDWFISIIAGIYKAKIFYPNPLSLYRQHDKNIYGYAGLRKVNIVNKIYNFFKLSKKINEQNYSIYKNLYAYLNLNRNIYKVILVQYLKELLDLNGFKNKILCISVIFMHVFRLF